MSYVGMGTPPLAVCPPGTTGTWPNCFDSASGAPACPAGSFYEPTVRMCVPLPPRSPLDDLLAPPPPPTSWWDSQSEGTRIAIAAGGVVAVGVALWMVLGKKRAPRRYTANKRKRGRKLTAAQRGAIKKIRGKRARAKTGKITKLKSGKSYGHLKPPKGYWKQGARRPSDYADPEHYKYPLIFRDDGKINRKKTKAHIRAAQSYFARNRRKYPPTIRRRIARNINKAKKRFGIGGKAVKA